MDPYSREEQNPMSDTEWDAALIREFEAYGPCESATAEYLEIDGTGVEFAHQNEKAWALIRQVDGEAEFQRLKALVSVTT